MFLAAKHGDQKMKNKERFIIVASWIVRLYSRLAREAILWRKGCCRMHPCETLLLVVSLGHHNRDNTTFSMVVRYLWPTVATDVCGMVHICVGAIWGGKSRKRPLVSFHSQSVSGFPTPSWSYGHTDYELCRLHWRNVSNFPRDKATHKWVRMVY